MGFEVGPKNGVPHLQGYMHFDNGKTMRHICNLVDNISLQEAKATGENFDRKVSVLYERWRLLGVWRETPEWGQYDIC